LIVDGLDYLLSLLKDVRKQLRFTVHHQRLSDGLDELVHTLVLLCDYFVDEFDFILLFEAALLRTDNIAPFLPLFYGYIQFFRS